MAEPAYASAEETCPACGGAIVETELGPVQVDACEECALLLALPDVFEQLGEALSDSPELLEMLNPSRRASPREGCNCPCGGLVQLPEDCTVLLCTSCFRRLLPWSELPSLRLDPGMARLGPLPPVRHGAFDWLISGIGALVVAAFMILFGLIGVGMAVSDAAANGSDPFGAVDVLEVFGAGVVAIVLGAILMVRVFSSER